MSLLDSIVGYPVDDHQVHIHYYKPRGDAKESWDNIDLLGFCGGAMQLKINFLCRDSILAAPLVIDLIRLMAVAKGGGRERDPAPVLALLQEPTRRAARAG
jgi:myo-inositol-1-phosphate synthase